MCDIVQTPCDSTRFSRNRAISSAVDGVGRLLPPTPAKVLRLGRLKIARKWGDLAKKSYLETDWVPLPDTFPFPLASAENGDIVSTHISESESTFYNK